MAQVRPRASPIDTTTPGVLLIKQGLVYGHHVTITNTTTGTYTVCRTHRSCIDTLNGVPLDNTENNQLRDHV